jgi:hypothetical protein
VLKRRRLELTTEHAAQTEKNKKSYPWKMNPGQLFSKESIWKKSLASAVSLTRKLRKMKWASSNPDRRSMPEPKRGNTRSVAGGLDEEHEQAETCMDEEYSGRTGAADRKQRELQTMKQEWQARVKAAEENTCGNRPGGRAPGARPARETQKPEKAGTDRQWKASRGWAGMATRSNRLHAKKSSGEGPPGLTGPQTDELARLKIVEWKSRPGDHGSRSKQLTADEHTLQRQKNPQGALRSGDSKSDEDTQQPKEKQFTPLDLNKI